MKRKIFAKIVVSGTNLFMPTPVGMRSNGMCLCMYVSQNDGKEAW